MPAVEQRTVPGDVGELRRLSAWWRDWASARGLAADRIDSGELCLNEAVENIIRYGGAARPIEISFEQVGPAARMTIADRLAPFNPLEREAPAHPSSLSEAQVGGLGIFLIRQYAADVDYRRDDGRNVLTLTF